MKLDELRGKLTEEDMMIAAVTNEVSDSYVKKIYQGRRRDKSEKAKAILKTLKKLALINDKALVAKQKLQSAQ